MKSEVFELNTKFAPAGDQPVAIEQLVDGLESGLASQMLLGVTGSGKTFTIANVISQLQRPTLIMAPNKTWQLSCMANSRDSSPKTRSSILCPTTTITSQKLMSRPLILI